MIKFIKHEYLKQVTNLFIWNDAWKIDMTASNVSAIIIFEQSNYLQYLLISNMMILFEFIISLEIT